MTKITKRLDERENPSVPSKMSSIPFHSQFKGKSVPNKKDMYGSRRGVEEEVSDTKTAAGNVSTDKGGKAATSVIVHGTVHQGQQFKQNAPFHW